MSTKVELIACSTCGSARRDERGKSEGERLFEQLLEQLLEQRAAQPAAGDEIEIALSSVQCLWACKQGCAVHLRSEGRVGYVLGMLEPSAEAAHGLLDYARLYGQSRDGGVPFKQWPQAVRGHFVCRLPIATAPAATESPSGSDPIASEDLT